MYTFWRDRERNGDGEIKRECARLLGNTRGTCPKITSYGGGYEKVKRLF